MGYLTEGLLEEAESYSPIHFIICESGSYNYWFHLRTVDKPVTRESYDLFYYRQPAIEKIKEVKQFGESITVDYYLINSLDN